MVPCNVYKVDAVIMVSGTCSRCALTFRQRAPAHRGSFSSTSMEKGSLKCVWTAIIPGPRPVSKWLSSIITSTVGAWCKTKMASDRCCSHRERSWACSSMLCTVAVVSTGACSRHTVTVQRTHILTCMRSTAGSRPVAFIFGVLSSLSLTAMKSRESTLVM